MAGDSDGYNEPWREQDIKRWDEQEYEQIRAAIAQSCCSPDFSHNPASRSSAFRNSTSCLSSSYKVAMVGGIYAGKSSVINTLVTALRNLARHEEAAITSESAVDRDTGAVTTQLRVFRLDENVNATPIRLTLADTMGIGPTCAKESLSGSPSASERQQWRRSQLTDMTDLMDGGLLDGFYFNHGGATSQNLAFVRAPNPGDEIDVVVLVVDVCAYRAISDDIWQLLSQIIQKAREKRIPCAVILTKIDQASPHVCEDVTLAFQCPEIKACAHWIKDHFGIDVCNIFPMQNYQCRERTDVKKNLLALFALENILHLARERMARQIPGNVSVDLRQVPSTSLLDESWRPTAEAKLTETTLETAINDLQHLEPESPNVSKLRIAYVGPSNSGKSVYINSIISALYGRVKTTAAVGSGPDPTTSRYQEYSLKRGRNGPEINIQLADTMGMESNANTGILTDDVASILDGFVADKTSFDPRHPVPRPESHSPPKLANRMHLLVLVVNGPLFSGYSQSLVDQLTAALTLSSTRGIPRVVLVSHVDRLCAHVSHDATLVYRSERVRRCLEAVGRKLRVPMADVWPVSSEHNNTEVDWRHSVLAVNALCHQVECAQDYVADEGDEGVERAEEGAEEKESWWKRTLSNWVAQYLPLS